MKSLMISFDIRSQELSLAQLTSLVGAQPDGRISHGIGDPRGDQQWNVTVWRRGVDIHNETDVSAAVNELLRQLSGTRVGQLPSGKALTVGVAFDTACASVRLSPETLARLGAIGAELEVSAYPYVSNDQSGEKSREDVDEE